MRLQFTNLDLPTVSRVLVHLYMGDYSDETYPLLGEECQSIPDLPGGHNTPPTQSTEYHGLRGIAAKNVHVYLCAKMLAIDPLKTLAVAKLDSRFRDSLDSANLAAAFSFVFEHTASEDTELRTMLMRICMENIALVKGDAHLASLLNQHEPVAWNLLGETWMKSVVLHTPEKASNTEEQSEINRLKAECEQMRIQMTSATTALVKLDRPLPAQESGILPGAMEACDLRKDIYHSETLKLAQAKRDLMKKQRALQEELQHENKKSPKAQTTLRDKVSILEEKLSNAQSNLKNAEAKNRAWGVLKKEKKSLKSEVEWLEDALDKAQKRVEELRKCSHCDKAFWALLKIDREKNKIYVKCGKCGRKHY